MTRCRPPLRHRGMDESHAQNHDIRTTDRRTEGEGKEEPIKFGAGQRRKARARDGAQPSSALIYANVKLAARTRARRVSNLSGQFLLAPLTTCSSMALAKPHSAT